MTNATETRSFHIGDILSVTSGKLVSPRHVDGIYDLLGWMTGEKPMTHQLPRLSRECAPSLCEQFPDLAALEVPKGLNSEEKVLFWLGAQEPEYGTRREVAPLRPGEHTSIDPITEMRMNHPHVQILPAVSLDGMSDIREAAARTAEALKRVIESARDDEEGSQA
ncbi:DUF7736 domain-containing protein [Nocardia sp. CY41]|uniref:DUF7736 domain-containing protein n=1 Tax=Nocardia sp. CY41 TaxID=2608686 RepID=UPI00135C060A|nr:hypothetical protein [Nocardia sp. CY41]